MQTTSDMEVRTGWAVVLSLFPPPKPEGLDSGDPGAPAGASREEPAPRQGAAPAEPGKPRDFPKAEEFCPRFTRVLTAAADKFTAIRGKGDAEEGWDTTVKLPGLSHCKIEALGPPTPLVYYSCEVSEQSDEASGRADLESLRRLAAQCLDESWEIGEPKPRSNSWKIELWKGEHEPDVELLLRGPGSYVKSWRLKLDINSPDPN
jgi:hypothetical protein